MQRTEPITGLTKPQIREHAVDLLRSALEDYTGSDLDEVAATLGVPQADLPPVIEEARRLLPKRI